LRWASRSWLPLAAAIAGVLATVLLWRSLLAVERRQLAFVAEAQARSAAAQVQRGMQAVTEALVGVARRFGPALREDRPWEFQITGLQATLWVEPSGKVGWVTPRDGHQGLVGKDLTASDADRAALVKAAATGKPSLTRSVVLPQQDSSFHLLVPVTAAGHLEGFLVGFFSGEVIYRAVLEHETAQAWALAVFEGDQELYRRGSPVGGRWIAESEVRVLDAERRVRAAPSPAVIAELHSPLPAVVLATGSVIALLLAASIGLAQSGRRRAGEAEAAQAALRVGEQQLRAILDNTMALVYVKDAQGRYLLLNRRLDEVFGRPGAEILGKRTRHPRSGPTTSGSSRPGRRSKSKRPHCSRTVCIPTSRSRCRSSMPTTWPMPSAASPPTSPNRSGTTRCGAGPSSSR
jgi:PAS domain-containing protein